MENWIDAGPNGNRTVDGKPKPMLQMTLTSEPLASYSQEYPLAYQFDCDQDDMVRKSKQNKSHRCLVPYRDFAHFMGGDKPWMKVGSPRRALQRKPKSIQYAAGVYLWFKTLGELNEILDMKLDFDNWHETHDVKESPLGKFSKYGDIVADHGLLKDHDAEQVEEKEDTEDLDNEEETEEVL